MKVEKRVLKDMILFTKFNAKQLKQLNFNFWLSCEYKEYPKTFLGLKIIKTNILKDETILLGTEEQFIKYNL